MERHDDFFGDSVYPKEELVAEMARHSFRHAGIETKTLKNTIAYLQSWLRALKGDCKLVIGCDSGTESGRPDPGVSRCRS